HTRALWLATRFAVRDSGAASSCRRLRRSIEWRISTSPSRSRGLRQRQYAIFCAREREWRRNIPGPGAPSSFATAIGQKEAIPRAGECAATRRPAKAQPEKKPASLYRAERLPPRPLSTTSGVAGGGNLR